MVSLLVKTLHRSRLTHLLRVTQSLIGQHLFTSLLYRKRTLNLSRLLPWLDSLGSLFFDLPMK